MQYVRLGNTGLVVSRLAFGTMTFGPGTGPRAFIFTVHEKLAHEMVARSIDAGINFFNTADAYAAGRSEEVLGRALGARRKDVIVATKVGFRSGEAIVHQGLSRHHIQMAAEASLKRLGTDYIDLYLAHRLDPYTPLEETLEAFDALVRQGKVRYVGFSNWPAWLAAKSLGLQREHSWAQFCAGEMYYSLVGRDLEHEFVPFALNEGVGIMAWSPLAGGFLTGKYTRENPQGDGGRLSVFEFIPVDRERVGYDLIDRMKAIAEAHGASVAQVALAWLLAKRHVTSILIGASKMNQLEDNLKSVDWELTAEELAGLDAMTAPTPVYPGGWFKARIVDAAVRDGLGDPEKA